MSTGHVLFFVTVMYMLENQNEYKTYL